MKHEISLKTPDDIQRLMRGGTLLRTTLETLVREIRPGMTGIDLDTRAEALLRAGGAEPAFKGYAPSGDPDDAFPATLCISVNSAVVHGVPTVMPFTDGDVVSLDIGCKYEGLYTDTATTVVLGNASKDVEALLKTTKESLAAGIDQVRAGATTGDIGVAVEKVAVRAGYSVIRDLVGHGVGYAIHEEPSIPNYGKPGGGVTLRAGMVIAIEPMVAMGSHEVEVAPDGWTIVMRDGSLAAHEELTVLVTENGSRILTVAKEA